MALRAAFCASAARATASPGTLVVEGVCATAATVRWATAPPARGSFLVEYGRGSVSSRRVTALGSARLRNLAPGAEYWVRVRAAGGGGGPPLFAGAVTTAMCAGDTGAGAATTSAAADVPAEPAAELPPVTELSRLELRVGRVVSVERHADADSLYVEQVDVGEAEPRTIVSGLVPFCAPEELAGRAVVVLCNLKPRAMRGVVSHGMLMCASNADRSQVDPLSPPPGAAVGELVTFDGHRAEPIAPGNRASKAFDRVADDLATGEDGVARFKGVPFMTKAGPCVSPKKLVGSVS